MDVVNVNTLAVSDIQAICEDGDLIVPCRNGQAIGIFTQKNGTAANDAKQ